MQVTQTTIHLKKMHFYAYHGVLPLEKRVGGWYTISLSLQLGNALPSLQKDELSHTINYAEVYKLIANHMQTPVNLLEHLAYSLLSKLFDHFPLIEKATIEVCKQTPPMGGNTQGASIELTAQRD